MDSARTESEILPALNAAARQILAVVAPGTLASVCVLFEERVDTAMTDGLTIVLPPTFDGVDVTTDATVGVGLLAHEVSHFLQPLAAIDQAQREADAPGWLANVILDIQGEALIESLFPPMARSLQAVRAVCWQVHGSEYEQALRNGQTFADVAGHAALIGRFREPGEPFTVAWLAAMGYRHAHGGALARFLRLLADALTVSANALPDLVRTVMATFPELKRAKVPPLPPLPLPMQAHGPFGGAAQQAARKLAELEPQAPVCVVDLDLTVEAPEARAVKLARVISLRFAEGRGGCEVAAPGRLDRRAAARGVGMPLRMTLPGRETLRPRVVICLDVSGSMWDQVKIAHARVAAQAVALAVQEGGGEAVGILFHEKAFVSLKGDASLLFASISRWPRGDTSFAFLGDAWRRWPEHRFVLVTDGDGDIPHILERDRERTAGILIAAGDANPEVLGALCGKVVELAAPEDLPWLVAMLIPRVRM